MMIRQTISFLDVTKKEENQLSTGKSFSEALIIASTNPQYEKRQNKMFWQRLTCEDWTKINILSHILPHLEQ